ncbi:MAG: phosphatidylserine decarboxylase [Desulfuromonadales bacterium]|nr:MAG: phosphatidylserine decarboxylase [Desulfuromonadales bacterium]
MTEHQYIERESGSVRSEKLFGDRLIRLLYHGARESAPLLFKMATSSWSSGLLGFINFDFPLGANRRFLEECGVSLSECLDPPESLDTPRKVFERRIRYEECRPMPDARWAVVSPADARVLVGSFRDTSTLFLKEKFFDFEELLGRDKRQWLGEFTGGDFAVFRLTPDKYHYNHTPVAGTVRDIYEIEGDFHSCNPGAVVAVATPFSKNRRVVTVIDTDVPGGTGVGLVAMIEVVALMIGQIVQCYSDQGYEDPRPVVPGMFLRRGVPKSLYRPGSSTDVLIFQRNRIRFADDIVRNMYDSRAASRFSHGFGRPLVETDVKVRSLVAVTAAS